MNKRPYTFDGVSLNDTNYQSWIPEGQTITATGAPVWTRGNNTYPNLSGTTLTGGTLTLMVSALGTLQSQQETLKALFDIDAANPKKLVVVDTASTADPQTQWYTYAYPLNFQRDGVSGTFEINLALTSPVWMTEGTTTEATWAISATGATNDYTIGLGNLSAYPIIEVTPSTARGAGFQYRRFVQTYNRTTVAGANYPIDITAGGLNTSALVSDTSVSNQINNGAGISDSQTTIPIDTAVGGGLPTAGMGYIVDGADSEQISWTGKTATDLTGVTRGIGSTVAKAHGDNKVIALSHMKADGSDIRVQVGTSLGDLAETAYWLNTTALASSTTTKIWIVYNYAARVRTDLNSTLTDAATSFRHTAVNPKPDYPVNGGTVLIDNERITYTSYNPDTAQFSGCIRGAFGTTAAAHSAGADINLIPIIFLYYGNVGAEAPAYSLSLKPIFNLTTSTNSSWVYADFYRLDPLQSTGDRWLPSATADEANYAYSTSENYALTLEEVDPAAVTGCSVVTTKAAARWTLFCSFGFTQAVFTTVKRINLPTNYGRIQSWYSNVTLSTYTFLAATTVANTWQTTASVTHSTGSNVHRYLRFSILNSGSVDITRAGAEAGACTVTLSTSTTTDLYGVPAIALGAEEEIEYFADFTLTNNTTGLSISFEGEIPFNETLRIDTLNKTVVALWDNSSKFPGLTKSTIRDEWLALQPGVNTLQYDEIGATGIDIVIKWQGRNN